MSQRLFDIVTGACILLVSMPLILALALWIKCDSPGPVLLRQKRVGRGAMVFDILKFRSTAPPGKSASSLTPEDDARVTRVGRFLRRYQLDDLPQLVNVLRGDMSLVGLRPERPRYVARYPADVRTLLLSVRPGLIDWASVYHKEERAILARSADPERAYVDEIMPATLAYYVRYMRERSFWSDARIVFATVGALLR